jgi:hypothetical protein
MMTCMSLSLALLANVVSAERAHLIISKAFTDPPVVEGRDVNITLTLTNVGDTAATDVVLSDKLRGPQFEVTAGEPVTKFDSVSAYVSRLSCLVRVCMCVCVWVCLCMCVVWMCVSCVGIVGPDDESAWL